MGLTRFAINIAAKLKKIEDYNTYLFIGPHPDDIEIGAGATIAKLVDLGKEVHFLICTDGRFGREHMMEKTPEEAAKIRREECLSSAKYLGIKKVHFLDLSDGAMYRLDKLKSGMAKVISEVKPDILFAPDPDVTSESHQDHLNVGRCAKELACFANFEDIFSKYSEEKLNPVSLEAIAFYMTAKPNIFVRTKKKYRLMQSASIFDHHVSQYRRGTDASNTLQLYLNLRSIEFGMKKGFCRAEGFRCLNQTRMHCLPEAGN